MALVLSADVIDAATKKYLAVPTISNPVRAQERFLILPDKSANTDRMIASAVKALLRFIAISGHYVPQPTSSSVTTQNGTTIARSEGEGAGSGGRAPRDILEADIPRFQRTVCTLHGYPSFLWTQ